MTIENENPQVEDNNISLPDSDIEIEQNVDDEFTESKQPEVSQNDHSAIEARAKKQGWKPKDEYGGNDRNWVTAEEYVAKAENELPVARSTIRKLEGDLDSMRSSIDRMTKYNELREERAMKEAIERLRKEQTKALEDESITASQAFDAFERGKERIESTYKPQVEQTKQPSLPAEVKDWVASNPWATTNDAVGFSAREYEAQIGNANPQWSALQVLEETKRRIIKDFPHKFNNPKRDIPSIEGGNTTQKSNVKQGLRFSQLPHSDQEDANKLIKQGVYKDQAEFLEDYKKFYKKG